MKRQAAAVVEGADWSRRMVEEYKNIEIFQKTFGVQLITDVAPGSAPIYCLGRRNHPVTAWAASIGELDRQCAEITPLWKERPVVKREVTSAKDLAVCLLEALTTDPMNVIQLCGKAGVIYNETADRVLEILAKAGKIVRVKGHLHEIFIGGEWWPTEHGSYKWVSNA